MGPSVKQADEKSENLDPRLRKCDKHVHPCMPSVCVCVCGGGGGGVLSFIYTYTPK